MAASRFSTTADFSIQHIWGTTLDDNTGINHSTQVDPKNYGLQIRGSTKILIDNCLIQQTYGDGIWLGHSAADGNVWTQEVRITNTNVNITARDGIAFGQACEGIYIGRTNFTNIFSQAVDSEPVEQPVRDVVVKHCHLGGWWNPGKPGRAVNAQLSIVGGKFLTGSQTVWARKFRVRDCTIDGACVIAVCGRRRARAQPDRDQLRRQLVCPGAGVVLLRRHLGARQRDLRSNRRRERRAPRGIDYGDIRWFG
jgi:hypothetical protein